MQNHGYDSMTRDRSHHDHDSRGHSRDRDRNESAFFASDRDRDFYDRNSHSGSWRNDSSGRSEEQFGRPTVRDLIASDRVEGTKVYGRDGNKLGTIHNFMVEKRGGQVRYAVMKSSEGFLGMDERYYPLEWSELDYDTHLDGYCINMSERDLDNRRSFDSRGRPIRDRSDDNRRSSW